MQIAKPGIQYRHSCAPPGHGGACGGMAAPDERCVGSTAARCLTLDWRSRDRPVIHLATDRQIGGNRFTLVLQE